jgi:hypothetical protein
MVGQRSRRGDHQNAKYNANNNTNLLFTKQLEHETFALLVCGSEVV